MARSSNKRLSASVRTEVYANTLTTTDEEIKNSPYDLRKAENAMFDHDTIWSTSKTMENVSSDMKSAKKYGNPSKEWLDKMRETYGNEDSNFHYEYLERSLPMPPPLAINNFTRNEEEIVFQKQRIKDYENGEELPPAYPTREDALKDKERRIGILEKMIEADKKQYKLTKENESLIFDLVKKLFKWEASSDSEYKGDFKKILDAIPNELKAQFLPPVDIVAKLYRGDRRGEYSKNSTYDMKEKEFSFTGSDNVATTFGGVDAQFKPSKEDTSKTAMYLDDDKFNQNVLKGTKARNVKYVLDPAQFRGWLLENYYNSGFPPAFWRHRGEDEFIVIGE